MYIFEFKKHYFFQLKELMTLFHNKISTTVNGWHCRNGNITKIYIEEAQQAYSASTMNIACNILNLV